MKRMSVSKFFTVKGIIFALVMMSFVGQSAVANPSVDERAFHRTLSSQTQEQIRHYLDDLLSTANNLDEKIEATTGESKHWSEYDKIDFEYDKNFSPKKHIFEKNISKIFNLPQKNEIFYSLKKLVNEREATQQKIDSLVSFYNNKFVLLIK